MIVAVLVAVVRGAARVGRGRRGAGLAHPGVAQPRRDRSRAGSGDLAALPRGVHRRGVPRARGRRRARRGRGVRPAARRPWPRRPTASPARCRRCTAERDALAAAQRAADEFAAAGRPAAVRGLLPGQTVALVDRRRRRRPTGTRSVELIEQAGGDRSPARSRSPPPSATRRGPTSCASSPRSCCPPGAQLPAASDTGSLRRRPARRRR